MVLFVLVAAISGHWSDVKLPQLPEVTSPGEGEVEVLGVFFGHWRFSLVSENTEDRGLELVRKLAYKLIRGSIYGFIEYPWLDRLLLLNPFL